MPNSCNVLSLWHENCFRCEEFLKEYEERGDEYIFSYSYKMYQAAEMRLMSSIENVFKNLHGGAGHHNLHAVMLPDDYDFVIYLNALRDQLEMQEDRDPAASDEENGARPFPTIALEENQVPLVFNWIKELKAEHVNLSRMHKTGLKMKLEIVMDRINKAMELMTSLSNILGQSELAKEISSLFYKNDGPEAQVLRLDKPVKVNHELMKQSAQMQALSPFALFLAHPFPPLTAETMKGSATSSMITRSKKKSSDKEDNRSEGAQSSKQQ